MALHASRSRFPGHSTIMFLSNSIQTGSLNWQIQRLAVREVLKQRLDRQPRSAKHRLAAEDSGVTHHQSTGGFVDSACRFHAAIGRE